MSSELCVVSFALSAVKAVPCELCVSVCVCQCESLVDLLDHGGAVSGWFRSARGDGRRPSLSSGRQSAVGLCADQVQQEAELQP